MDENLGFQSGLSRPGLNPPSVQFENGFCEASSELIQGGLGAYGKRICGSSSQYVQSNVSFIKPCTDSTSTNMDDNQLRYDVLRQMI